MGKVIKKWVVSHLGKTAFVVEHDFLMATALADRVIVFKGQPGLECTACAPYVDCRRFSYQDCHMFVIKRCSKSRVP